MMSRLRAVFTVAVILVAVLDAGLVTVPWGGCGSVIAPTHPEARSVLDGTPETGGATAADRACGDQLEGRAVLAGSVLLLSVAVVLAGLIVRDAGHEPPAPSPGERRRRRSTAAPARARRISRGR